SVVSKDGLGYTLLIERGKSKAQVRTSFKWKKEQLLDVTSPKPNVRNDTALSSNKTIPQSEGKIKYSFAGKKAKTADKDSLNRAMAMDESGASRNQIYRETGWVKGRDNKWRFEIPDNLNKINLGKLVRDGKAILGEIYDNPKLYAAYPQLKNISVKTSDEMKSSGNFNPSKNTITLNKEVAEVLPDRAKQTLVHELQHAIQKIEGFAFGSGKSNSDYKNLGGEQEAREVAARADMSKDKLRSTTPTIHDENAVIIFADKKYTVNPNQHETPNDESSYSIDSNDNSSESLSQKIRNKFSAWWNGNPKKNRNKEITDLLYRTTGYKVDFGNVKDADQTIIDDVHKVIRAKHAYEWEKLLPQIGGKIAKTLKLNPTQEMSNYIADWCMTGAVGNRSAEAKAFEKAMHDDPITAGLMLQIRDAFQEFNDMSAQEKISDTIVSRLKGKSPKEIAKTLWGEKEEQITDDLHPVLRQVNEMITKAEKTSPTLAKLMKEDINPYQMMRLLRGVGGLGDLILHANAQNIEDVRNQFRALYPSRKFDRLVSLDMIIDMAGGKNHDKGLIDFAVAKLDKEMHEKLRANPNEDLRPQFSEAVDDEIIKAGEKQYSEAHRALVTYSNILACIQYDAGLLTDSQFRKMMKGWKNYIPMIRVFDEEEDFKFEDSLKHKTGSQRSTYNPLETLTQNTYDALSRAERNKAKQQLAFYARIGEFGDIIQEVETSNPGKNIIHYRENGEMKYLKVFDPAVKRAVDNIYTPADTSWIMKFLKATMSFVRSMRTLASTDFAIGNPFRDMQDAYIHNRHADANPFVAMLNVFREGFKGFGLSRMLKEKSLVPHDTDWVEFNALGGTQSTFVSEDVDQLRRSMNKLTRKTFKERFKENKLQTILESMQW
ncbi:MAG: hypothetical protein IJQ82_14375, partial [Selenomonadaceae bacterium]|nr:hypothetical protein [Selenomonadaceae bacterium]